MNPTVPRCVLCGKPVDPDDAQKQKYVVHLKCYEKVAPRLTEAVAKRFNLRRKGRKSDDLTGTSTK